MERPLIDKVTSLLPSYRKSVQKTLFTLVHCILHRETCNLYGMRGAVGTALDRPSTKPSSHYKRIVRFFRDHGESELWLDVLSLGFSLLRLKADYLLLDGTSWERGERRIHLLTLCVIYKGVAIPICWEDLAKKGTSNHEERKKLLGKARGKLNLSGKVLLADREYIGSDWFGYLVENLQVDYIIRLKRGVYKKDVDTTGGLRYTAMEKKVLRSKKPGKAVAKDFVLDGMPVRITMVKNLARNDRDKIIYLISTQKGTPKKTAADYFKRWKIETCFKHLKSSGFNLEAINLKDAKRARLLIALVVLAYTLAVVEGIKQLGKIPMKRYADGTCYVQTSIFREGIDRLVATNATLSAFCLFLYQLIQQVKQRYRNPNAIFVQ